MKTTIIRLLILSMFLAVVVILCNKWLAVIEQRQVVADRQEVVLQIQEKKAIVKNIVKVKIIEYAHTKLPQLNLELLGVWSEKANFYSALIKDSVSGYKGIYKIGARIKDSVLVKIGHGQVELLRPDGIVDILQLSASMVDEDRIDVKNVISRYQNPNNILKSISISPEISKGRVIGIKLDKIEADSLPEQLGFKENDIISKINGCSLNSFSDVVKLYSDVRSQYQQTGINIIEIAFQRDGKPIKVNYQVR